MSFGISLVLPCEGPGVPIPFHREDGELRGFFWVDRQDVEWARQFNWHLHSMGYAARVRKIKGRSQSLLFHRELLGLEAGDGLEADHKNFNRLDNRRSNLRVCTHAENHQNRKPVVGAASRFRGVSLHRQSGLWRARCKLKGKEYALGYFSTEEEAGAAARRFRREHMPFALD